MSEWQRTVRTGRRDASEPAVVEAFEDGEAAVVKHSGKDEPDLFVGFLGYWHPVETKTDNGKLSEGQLRWWCEVAKTPPVVARTPAQAKKLLRIWTVAREREIAAAIEMKRLGGGSWQAIEDSIQRGFQERAQGK